MLLIRLSQGKKSEKPIDMCKNRKTCESTARWVGFAFKWFFMFSTLRQRSLKIKLGNTIKAAFGIVKMEEKVLYFICDSQLRRWKDRKAASVFLQFKFNLQIFTICHWATIKLFLQLFVRLFPTSNIKHEKPLTTFAHASTLFSFDSTDSFHAPNLFLCLPTRHENWKCWCFYEGELCEHKSAGEKIV